jgi:Flp pilus assembly protein TadD
MAIRALMMEGQYEQALARVDAYLAEGETANLLSLRSTALDELGRDEESLAACERAHVLDSDDVSLNNNLSYLYAVRGIHLVQAEQMSRQALQAAPSEAAFLDTLAWVLYKQGHVDQAAALLRRVLQGEDEPNAVILDHAGDAFWRLGWTALAQARWQQAADRAAEETKPLRETRTVAAQAAGKLQALAEGNEPPVAPLSPATSQPANE